MDSISCQDIRKIILDFLEQRLLANNNYKIAVSKLEKAIKAQDFTTAEQIELVITKLKKRHEFEFWMNDAFTRRLFWCDIATNTSKAIHSSSKGSNVNYLLLNAANNLPYISSATPNNLPLDCSGNAAALDIFSLLNQKITNKYSFLDLILQDHPQVLPALSDDKKTALQYLTNIKKWINNDFEQPKSSELNKQIFWPVSSPSYLSASQDNYHILVPLHPNSLCHVVYQKIQTVYSEQNKKAREDRLKNGNALTPYFSFNDLAYVKLGGTNPQGVSQLVSQQMGKNFLLPSLPPKLTTNRYPSITKMQTTIFNPSLQYYCRQGFRLLFDVVKADTQSDQLSETRDDAFEIILTLLIKFVGHVQTTMPAGWSRDYALNKAQQYLLDPLRISLDDESEFKQGYEQFLWLNELAEQFSFWIVSILKHKFPRLHQQFTDPDYQEYFNIFRHALNIKMCETKIGAS